MLDIPTLEAIKYLLAINTTVIVLSTIVITNALYDIRRKG